MGDSPVSGAHWLVIEFRNRGEFACKLVPLTVAFPPDGPQVGEDAFTKETSSAATAVQNRSQLIAPRDMVHALLTWTSVPVEIGGIVFHNCGSHDTMTVGPMEPSFSSKPWLEVRHLWIRSCDSMWRSAYRLGPYTSSEPIAKEWLERVHLHESDFAGSDAPATSEASMPPNPEFKFWTSSDVQFLAGTFGSGYWGSFPLFLETSSGGFPNCPIRSMRKREADGQTTIYLSHCEDNSSQLPPAGGAKAIYLWSKDFGLSPERTGRVEYHVVSNILQNDKLKLAKAALEISIRDPNQPMLPTIDTDEPGCQIAQLKLTTPIVELGTHWDRPTIAPSNAEDWYDGKVFEVTNTSGQSCMLGGVPALKFLGAPPPWHSSGSLSPARCGNCPTSLFKPRESRWIELKPNDSAHFIVVRGESHLAYSFWCNLTGGIELSLPGDKQAVQLPFVATFCGPIPVSAWRAGKYDNDPMNVAYDHKEKERQQQWLSVRAQSSSKVVCIDNTKPQSQLPPPGLECAAREFALRGRPAMSAVRRGVAMGVSSPPGRPTAVYIWMDNQSDQSQSYYMCCRNTFLADFNVYDSGGHRLLSKREQAQRKGCAEGQEMVMVCGCSTMISVAPHTKQTVDSGDLEGDYVLSPGRYFIVPSELDRSNCASFKKTQAKNEKTEPTHAIAVEIQEP